MASICRYIVALISPGVLSICERIFFFFLIESCLKIIDCLEIKQKRMVKVVGFQIEREKCPICAHCCVLFSKRSTR